MEKSYRKMFKIKNYFQKSNKNVLKIAAEINFFQENFKNI